MNIIHWVIENKEWLFSGIFVAFLSWLLFLLGRKRQNSQVNQKQSSGNSSQNIQAGRDVNISLAVPHEFQETMKKLEAKMPELFKEMRNDLVDNKLAREFVIMKRNWVFNSDPNDTVLVYYFDDHSDLKNKLRILENHNLIKEVTFNKKIDRFKMSEELSDYLMAEK